jgi:hypothetical protein
MNCTEYAAHAPDGCVVIDLKLMTRRAEVVNYAHQRDIDVADAIIELVNAGLSTQ